MFNNPGKKIKGLAKLSFVIGLVVSVALAIVMFAIAEDSYVEAPFIIAGLLCIIVGPFLSWLSSIAVYGFGELVENSTQIKDHLEKQ